MENIKDLQNEMQKLSSQIATVLSVSKYEDYDDLSGIEYHTNNPDDLLLVNEYKSILCKLSDIQYVLEYLNKPILFEDTLILRSDGRYGTRNGKTYYTSGSRIEFFVNYDKPAWKTSTVECNGTEYYIVGYKDIALNGLRVRIR